MKNDELLVALYPRLYHMSHAGSWPNILKYGLLSTTALLDLFEITGGQRIELEERQRANSVQITHPQYGAVMLRDQKPLNEKKLANALDDGLSTRDWCRLLNGKVFFWAPESRLGILRGARAYEADRQTILVVDTARVVQRHRNALTLCHMNSGATQPMAFRRGLKTFLAPAEYPLAERRRKYGVKGAVAEVTVEYAVPNVGDVIVEAYEVGGGAPREDLWTPT